MPLEDILRRGRHLAGSVELSFGPGLLTLKKAIWRFQGRNFPPGDFMARQIKIRLLYSRIIINLKRLLSTHPIEDWQRRETRE